MSISVKQHTIVSNDRGDSMMLPMSEHVVSRLGMCYAAIAHEVGKVQAIKMLRSQFADQSTGASTWPLALAKEFIEHYMD